MTTLSRWGLNALAVVLTVALLHQVTAREFASAEEVHEHNAHIEAVISEAAERYGVSGRLLRCIAWHESKTRIDWLNMSYYNPEAVGDYGASLGLVQLHRNGLRPHFYQVGYVNPFDPWESADYLARAVSGEWRSQGVGVWHWTTWRANCS